MKPEVFESALYTIKGSELSLSRVALAGLMRGVLARGIPFRFRAKGWSMTPFILDGDVISVSPLPRGLPGIGDVVAFMRPEMETLVVHRVIARRGGACLIQSDNSHGGDDGLVPRESILGRVTRVERGGRVIRLGLGPERLLIALLSRLGLLLPLWQRLSPLLRPFFRRSVQ